MNSTLGIVGVVCLMLATIGGGLKALRFEIPLLSTKRQMLLGALGVILVASASLVSSPARGGKPRSQLPPVEQDKRPTPPSFRNSLRSTATSSVPQTAPQPHQRTATRGAHASFHGSNKNVAGKHHRSIEDHGSRGKTALGQGAVNANSASLAIGAGASAETQQITNQAPIMQAGVETQQTTNQAPITQAGVETQQTINQAPIAQAGAETQQTTNHAPITRTNSGGCSQLVLGGNSNVTNCAPTALVVNDEEARKFRDNLSAVSKDIKINVWYEMDVENGEEIQKKLAGALRDAGFNAEEQKLPAKTYISCSEIAYPGLSIDCIDSTNSSVANGLGDALQAAGIVTKDHPIYLGISKLQRQVHDLDIIIRRPMEPAE